MSTFSFDDRNSAIKDFQSEVFDIAIIGGGITGAGIARDASSRGMKVALVEARDFASGTSSKSSKLIHGGLRYLESYEFGLVFEALSERKLLFEIAPHLVHPLRFLVPLYKGDRISMLKMGAGMWIYDILSLFEAPQLHDHFNSEVTCDIAPGLRKTQLKGSYTYSDAYMDDDRLVVETLRSAKSNGARIANYIRVVKINKSEVQVNSMTCKNSLDDSEFKIRAKHFISSVGPWTDSLGNDNFSDWKNILRPSKGIHLVIPIELLPIDHAIVMAAATEKRIIFAIPRNDVVILGTTDTDFEGNPSNVNTTREDVEYLKEIVEYYFPHIRLSDENIISSYAGVRPLIDDHSLSESDTSREHKIFRKCSNMTFVAGGKYTTYRKMAQEIVDSALSTFKVEDRVEFSNSNTKIPLNPLVSGSKYKHRYSILDNLIKENLSLSEQDVILLLDRHGVETKKFIEEAGQLGLKRFWEIEAYIAVHYGCCLKLEDFYTRRTPLFLFSKNNGLDNITVIGQAFKKLLHLSDLELQEQKDQVLKRAKSEFSWKEN